MVKIILHADDFGLHPEIDRAIIDSARGGILRSASLLANGPSAREALQAASEIPTLALGIHLNIVRGRPLSHPSQVKSLVGPEGRFFNSVSHLLLKSALGRLNGTEILTEYRAQIRFMLENGFVPTHIDGEKHTHLLLYENRRVLEQLQREFSINKVRTVNERRLQRILASKGFRASSSLRQNFKLTLLERASARARAYWKEIRTPDLFFGVLMSGRLALENGIKALKTILSLDSSAVIEWMFHPGYTAKVDPEFGRFFLGQARVKETEFLLSDEIRDEVSKRPRQFISYGEI